MTNRPVYIIDYNHMAHKFRFSKAAPLSVTVMMNGFPTTIDTTIPNYTIKQIWRWSNGGLNPTIVCFDSPLKSRKWAMHQSFLNQGLQVDYKQDRTPKKNDFFRGIEATQNILNQAGVITLKRDNYEADDLVFAALVRAKEQFPDSPIYIITNDWDLSPLCDDQVSVYIRSNKQTYNEKGPRITKYVEVTPESYQYLAQDTTQFKNNYVPYNTVLLWKLLRGDKSDKIPGLMNEKGQLKWKPKAMERIIQSATNFGYDVPNGARYGETPRQIILQDTKRVVTMEEINAHPEIPKSAYKILFGQPKELQNMLNVYGRFFDDEDLDFIKERYQLMNLNGAFVDVPLEYKRAPFKITGDLRGFDENALARELQVLGINLPAY